MSDLIRNLGPRSRLVVPGTCAEWKPTLVELDGEATAVWCTRPADHVGQHESHNAVRDFHFVWADGEQP